MHIAIIPARSGSKRIKNKNIKKFINEPIISKTIKIIKKFEIFDKIYVSTNSNTIKKIAEKSGAIAPFLRDKKLSGDTVITHDVIIDLIKKTNSKDVLTVTCLYPTSVFIQKKYILEALGLLKKNPKKYVFSATKYEHPIQRAFSIHKNKTKLYKKYTLKTRTQDFISYYHDAAQFYVANKKTWLSSMLNFGRNGLAIKIDTNKVQDLDYPNDWKLAEIKFKTKEN